MRFETLEAFDSIDIPAHNRGMLFNARAEWSGKKFKRRTSKKDNWTLITSSSTALHENVSFCCFFFVSAFANQLTRNTHAIVCCFYCCKCNKLNSISKFPIEFPFLLSFALFIRITNTALLRLAYLTLSIHTFTFTHSHLLKDQTRVR